jgi:DNA (cytosine-5)-methyltransferase 1
MDSTIKVIDLFAGVGGIRVGVERASRILGYKTECVYTSEIDKYACEIYRKNFPKDNHDPLNDVTKCNEKSLADFNLLLAGFPCQAFSIAGRRGGFEDTRGTLFFDVGRIIKEKQPDAFLLENVKGLTNHKGGKTLSTILNVLKDDLGYTSTQFRVLNAKHYGVPQNRERIYIVGFKNGGGTFEFPDNNSVETCIEDIIEKNEVSPRFYVSETSFESMKRHKERHKSKGNGFGYEIKDMDGIANAIVIGGMGKERNLVVDDRLTNVTPETKIKGEINKEFIRRMTPLEWERLQGYPDNWTEGVSNTQRYKQMGNSVAVPVIEAIAYNIIKELLNPSPFVDKTKLQMKFDFNV